jgi:multidrug resistance efflux pump
LRTAADWPKWLDQAKAVVKLLELEDYVSLEGKGETRDITKPEELETPQFPEGEDVTQAQWDRYDRLMQRHLIDRDTFKERKRSYEKHKERHRDLISILQQSISDDVSLVKSSEAAEQPTTLVAKVKELLLIDDKRTIRNFEAQWLKVLNRDLKKVGLEAWKDEVI